MKIDDFDIAILNLVQDNAQLKSESIAESIGLSPTACQRRLRRLREDGAIASEIAVIDPSIVGGRVTMIVQVVLERGGSHTVDAFKRKMREAPEVQQCYYVTGEYDFILLVTARDIADYEQLTRRIFFENSQIQKFHTIVTMENVKVGLGIPL